MYFKGDVYMEKLLDLKKGDSIVVAIEPSSNASRWIDMSVSNINNWTFDGVVVSAGKKYITVEFKGLTMKFVVDDNYRNKYNCGGADYRLYPTKEDVYNRFKSQELYDKIKRKFSNYKNAYDLETLSKIWNLLESDK